MAVSEEVAGGRGKGVSPWADRSGKGEVRKTQLISTLLSGKLLFYLLLLLSVSSPHAIALCLHIGEKGTSPQTHLPKEDHLTLVASGRPQLCKRGPPPSFIHLFTQQIFIDDLQCTKPRSRRGRDSVEQDR